MSVDARNQPLPRTARPRCRVRVATINDISPMLREAWCDLEGRAIEPNAYLSPHFALPAIRHLDRDAGISIALIESGAPGSTTLIGAGLFRGVAATRTFPLPHLVAYRSAHSFLSGLLIDRDRALDAVEALFDHLYAIRWRWHGVEMSGTWSDGVLSDIVRACAAARGLWREDRDPRARALLVSEHRTDQLDVALRARGKQVKRNMRKLEERGQVSWSVQRDAPISESGLESFLHLEHQGWKGETGTSLRSNPAEEAFFRDVVFGFGKVGRALFTELKLDGKVISSTSNFISGRGGFAFKVGWLPELAKMSPGVLNEVELMRSFQQGACSDLEFFDSGATEGSYMDNLWTGRRTLISTAIASTRLGAAALRASRLASAVKRRLRRAPRGEAAVESVASNAA